MRKLTEQEIECVSGGILYFVDGIDVIKENDYSSTLDVNLLFQPYPVLTQSAQAYLSFL